MFELGRTLNYTDRHYTQDVDRIVNELFMALTTDQGS